MDEDIRLLEKKRQSVKGLLNFIRINDLVGGVFAIILTIMFFANSRYVLCFFLVFLLCAVIICILEVYAEINIRKKVREFDNELRDSIVRPYIFERYGGPEYISQNRFTLDEVEKFQVVSNAHLWRPVITTRAFYNSEDYIRGTYKGVPYEQSSVQMCYTFGWKWKYAYRMRGIRSLKPRYTFKGRVLLFASPRLQNINSLKITTKSFSRSSWLGFNETMIRINDLFDSEFYVNAVNPQDAYDLLTPQLMAEIANIKNYFSDFTICINQGIVSVAINNLDSPFDRAYEAPLDRHQIYQLTDEYMNVTSKMLDTFFTVFL